MARLHCTRHRTPTEGIWEKIPGLRRDDRGARVGAGAHPWRAATRRDIRTGIEIDSRKP